MRSKKALIFGITGQDGAYLSNLLLKKNYEVHGVKRRSSSFNTMRIDELYNEFHEGRKKKSYGSPALPAIETAARPAAGAGRLGEKS